MEKKFERQFGEAEAKKALFDVKHKLHGSHTSPQDFLMRANPDKSELINIASFKMALHNLKCLALHDIDNLTKYMDKKNEGFIGIGDFTAAVERAAMSGSFRSTKGHTNKWLKDS